MNEEMKRKETPSLGEWFRSFYYAAVGLLDMLRTEHNAWVHAIFTVLVLALSWWLQLEGLQFSLIVLAVVVVWSAEAFNTVLELLTNMISPDFSHQAKRAKDIAAGGVLIACVGAAILGFCILGPLLWERLSGLFSS